MTRHFFKFIYNTQANIAIFYLCLKLFYVQIIKKYITLSYYTNLTFVYLHYYFLIQSGYLAKATQSLTDSTPVRILINLSKPRPIPPVGHDPSFLLSV